MSWLATCNHMIGVCQRSMSQWNHCPNVYSDERHVCEHVHSIPQRNIYKHLSILFSFHLRNSNFCEYFSSTIWNSLYSNLTKRSKRRIVLSYSVGQDETYIWFFSPQKTVRHCWTSVHRCWVASVPRRIGALRNSNASRWGGRRGNTQRKMQRSKMPCSMNGAPCIHAAARKNGMRRFMLCAAVTWL